MPALPLECSVLASWRPGVLASWRPGVLASWRPGVLTPSVGDKPGDVPPMLVVDAKDRKKSVWDNPCAFGPVPAELAANGEKVCSSLNTENMQFKAIGFHPKAKAADGSTFPNGGYFCVRK